MTNYSNDKEAQQLAEQISDYFNYSGGNPKALNYHLSKTHNAIQPKILEMALLWIKNMATMQYIHVDGRNGFAHKCALKVFENSIDEFDFKASYYIDSHIDSPEGIAYKRKIKEKYND